MTMGVGRRLTWIAAGAIGIAAAGLAAVLALETSPGGPVLDAGSIDLTPLDRVPAAVWDSLSKKRIYFGHMSVGYDVIAGVEEIRKRKPEVRLEFVETDDLARIEGPAFVHSRVGRNEDPSAKIADFERRMTSPGSERVDIAFVKLCYADVGAATPVAELFAESESALSRLEAARPRTKFVRVSVPLTARPSGLKATLKRLAGRGPDHDADNRAREAFNGLVRSRCRGNLPLFDIAAAESRLPDGTDVAATVGGAAIPSLAPGYTTDGGHLNGAGRLVAARDMLLVLAELAR
jgi:hypothetical protein